MNKIALVTDSACDLSEEEFENHNIYMLPLRIIYKDREYRDRVDMTSDEIYKNLQNEVPSTSLPSMEDISSLFSKLEQEGYSQVIVICISSGLSGTYNSINVVSRNYPKIKCHIFDSRSLSLGTGSLVLACAEMIDSGKSFDEIVEKLPSIRSRIRVYYVLDTLTYLIKGGRIGKVAGTIGQFLNIRPIISINEEGVYYTYAKARGRKQSISKLIEIASNALSEGKAKIWVMHGGALEEGKSLYDDISKLPNITELGFRDISPVLGVHTGPGTLGIIVMKE